MSNQQVWVLTDYGKNRVTEVVQSQSEQIVISTIKIGDALGTYYVPSGTETELKHIVGDEDGYPVSSKSLLKDDNDVYNIVSFGCFIQETTGGYEVREMGLYETITNDDNTTSLMLFAIGTCEPINMPAVANGYDIAIDFELRLKSTNLATAYDKIYLDPKNDFLEQGDLDELSNTVLYVEGNLMEQISSNSHVIGLNRAQQLNEYIEDTLYTYSNTASTDILSSINNYVTDMSSVMSFWLFNHTNWFDSQASIRDFSFYGYDITLSNSASSFALEYFGVAPSLNVSGTNSYTVPANTNFHLLNAAKTADSPFTIFAILKPNGTSEDNTILAQSNYFTGVHNFEIVKTSDDTIKLTLFTDASNYVTFETTGTITAGKVNVIAIKYDGTSSNPSVSVFINGKSVAYNKTTTGTYAGMTANLLPTTSYITNNSGTTEDNINSKVSLITIIKEALSDLAIRGLNQNLLALAGNNIYYEV